MTTLRLRAFLFGQSGERDSTGRALDYRLLSIAPPEAAADAAVLAARLDPLVQAWAGSVTSRAMRLLLQLGGASDCPTLFPRRVGAAWAYVRVLPSRTLDSSGRVVRRYRTVALDTVELEALAWRPWRLDPFLPDGDGGGHLPNWVLEPNDTGGSVNAALELDDIELERLDAVEPLEFAASTLVERGVRYLERGSSVFFPESQADPTRAGALAGALFACCAQRAMRVGVGLSAPCADNHAMRQLAAHGVCVLTVAATAGRMPSGWVDVERAPDAASTPAR